MNKLKKYNQEHLLKFVNELSGDEKKGLYNQIESLDFSYLDEIGKNNSINFNEISPIDVLTIEKIEKNKQNYEKIGLNSIKNGEVAALILAGGMGTRLGFDGPKGMYNIGITRDLYIFECLINNLKNVTSKAGVVIPLFIMTSDKNDKATKDFLKSKNYFGYDEKYIKFFIQD
ncbi:MAG: UTP--glucose-1-phosphate uridylyltransferase, partial [Clostridia bacterium]|nr:UTP--glucose-1-phosphate uridylyltransferase [Clostridia bacterium]